MPIEILWDGGIALAVNKPPELPTQAPPQVESLESRLRTQLGARGEYLAFPHRLDRAVSGLVLVALRKRAARLLSDQFVSHKIKKVYLAQLSGQVTESSETWVDWLRKVPDQPRATLCEPSDAGAKRAETHAQVIRFDADARSTLMRLMPVTGRMHQLRLQSASRGHPIVGDPVYGPAKSSLDSPSRIMLHAHCLEFHDPQNGARVRIEASNDAGMVP